MPTPPPTNFPWLLDIFPDADAPYTLPNIHELLQLRHTPGLSRSCVYRAHKALSRSLATRADVQPRPRETWERTLQFDAPAARLIAKRATRCKPPCIKKKPVEKPIQSGSDNS